MSDVDEVKSRLNIVDIVGERVPLKKAGRNFKALCPFHNEKTPSFIVSPDRQTFHCFGCNKGGSVIDFVMEYEHIDFIEALEQLAAKAGVKLERRRAETPEGKLKERIIEVNHLASEFYHYLLTKHRVGEKARDYLRHRGITDKSIQTFLLGYSANNWDGLLRFLRKKSYDEALLEQAGLILKSQISNLKSQSRYYDRFRGRIMFTLKDHRGNVVGFAGRSFDPHPLAGGQAHQEAKYINTSETPVYTKSNVLYGLDVTKGAIQKAGEAVVVEGELDVISLFQAGISHVVGIKGSALTEGHVNLLKRFTERLVFALDSDVAGDAASRRGIELADRGGLDMKVVVLPQGKDPDDMARESPGLLKKVVRSAVPIYDYFLTSSLKRFDPATAFGKRKIAEEIVPVLAKIENAIVQSHYAKELARVLDVPQDAIVESIRGTVAEARTGVRKSKSAEQTIQPLSRPERLEIYLLGLLLQGKTRELYDELKETVQSDDFVNSSVRLILDHLEQSLKATRVFLIKDFADRLPRELVPTLDEAFLWDISDFLDNEERFAKEWTKALREFRRMMLRRKIHFVTTKLHKALEPGEDSAKEEKDLQKQLSHYIQELKTLESPGSI